MPLPRLTGHLHAFQSIGLLSDATVSTVVSTAWTAWGDINFQCVTALARKRGCQHRIRHAYRFGIDGLVLDAKISAGSAVSDWTSYDPRQDSYGDRRWVDWMMLVMLMMVMTNDVDDGDDDGDGDDDADGGDDDDELWSSKMMM
eukprot:6372746-Pyramimonas_sp.AAC.1